MLNKKNRKRCGKVIKVYPEDHQMMILMEELAELIQATSKLMRYNDMDLFLEEYSDVHVMLEEMRQLLHIKKSEVNKRAKKKLYRALEGRVIHD